MPKGKIAGTRGRRGLAFVFKTKKRPRGRAFPKGHKFGNRFKAGQSGNPGGRPKSKEISVASRAWLAAVCTADELRRHKLPLDFVGHSHAEVITWIRGQQALSGNLSDAAELADRAEGKPHTSLSIDETPNPIVELIATMNVAHALVGPPEQPSLGDGEPKFNDQQAASESN